MSFFLDTHFILRDDGDPTKEAWFQCSSISHNTRRQYTFPDKDGTFAMLSDITAGVTDHGALTGLLDDDHTQYALLAGRTGTATIFTHAANTHGVVRVNALAGTAAGVDIFTAERDGTRWFRVEGDGQSYFASSTSGGIVNIAGVSGGKSLTIGTSPTTVVLDHIPTSSEFRYRITGTGAISWAHTTSTNALSGTWNGDFLFKPPTSGTTTVPVTIRGITSQTGNLLNLQTATPTTVAFFDAKGGLAIAPAAIDAVLLKLTANAGQTSNVMEVHNFFGTHKDFTIEPGGIVTVSSYDATDDDVRLQVRAPNTQTTGHNIFQVVRSYSAAGVGSPNLYSSFTVGGTGSMVVGDLLAHGAAVIRLKLNQGSGQSVDIFQVRNTADTASLFALDKNSQLSLADYITTSKTLRFKLTDSTASTDLALDYRTAGNRGLIWDLSGASTGTVTAVALVAAGTGYTTGAGKATTGGSGTGCTINITTVGGGGAITAVASAPTAAGTGYKVGDVLTITTGGTGGTVRVVSLGGSLTLAWAGTTTSRTITFPSTASFTVAGLQLANVFTTLQTITRSTDGQALQMNFDESAQTVDVFAVTGTSAGTKYLSVDSTGGMNAVAFSIWPSGIGTSFAGTFVNDTLSANRVYTFPNTTGAVLVAGAAFSSASLSVSVGTTTLVSSGNSTLWMISAYLECNTAEAGTGVVTLTIGWNDGTARTFPICTKTLTSTGIDQGVLVLYVDTSSNITYSTTYTPTAGGVTETYRFRLRATSLGVG